LSERFYSELLSDLLQRLCVSVDGVVFCYQDANMMNIAELKWYDVVIMLDMNSKNCLYLDSLDNKCCVCYSVMRCIKCMISTIEEL
jgi:hypothetical protein